MVLYLFLRFFDFFEDLIIQVSSFISSGSALETAWVLTKGTLELLAEIHVMMVKNLQVLLF